MKPIKIDITLAELLKGHTRAQIRCPISQRIVGKLVVNGEQVKIDAFTDVKNVPLNLSLYYDPWIFDRGSILFDSGKPNVMLKLCTEFDTIEYLIIPKAKITCQGVKPK